MAIVSVIIPCFNVQDYVADAIQSVLAQSHKELELICVDNNSTDNTIDILTQFKSQFPDKIIILEEKKRGASAARNKGLFAAKGEWIQFLDADDLLLPNKIAGQLKLVDPDVVFIAGTSSYKKLNGEAKLRQPIQDVWMGLFTNQLGDTCANLWNAAILKQISGWNEEYTSSQETELMFRILKQNKNVQIDLAPNTVVRERAEGQISQSNPVKKFIRYCSLRNEIIEYLKQNKTTYFSKNANQLYQYLFDFIRTLANYDLEEAYRLFKSFIPANFKPTTSLATSRSYLFLYKAFGFYLTEKIKGIRGK